MTIQGIIFGVADPEDTTKHVIIVGRERYAVVVNGYTVAVFDTLPTLTHLPPRYRAVRGISTDAFGYTTVTELA